MRKPLHDISRWAGGYLFASVFVVGMVILYTGSIPVSVKGWIIIFLFGLPVWLFGEWLGEKMFSEKISRRLDPSDAKISPVRMSYALLVMLAITIMIISISFITKKYMAAHLRSF